MSSVSIVPVRFGGQMSKKFPQFIHNMYISKINQIEVKICAKRQLSLGLPNVHLSTLRHKKTLHVLQSLVWTRYAVSLKSCSSSKLNKDYVSTYGLIKSIYFVFSLIWFWSNAEIFFWAFFVVQGQMFKLVFCHVPRLPLAIRAVTTHKICPTCNNNNMKTSSYN